MAAAQWRRHRHRRGLPAARVGHPGPDPVPLHFLRQPRPDPGDAWQQAADALRADDPPLVQPQHPHPVAPQHPCPLRYRQLVLFGVARSEHDLFVGAV